MMWEPILLHVLLRILLFVLIVQQVITLSQIKIIVTLA